MGTTIVPARAGDFTFWNSHVTTSIGGQLPENAALSTTYIHMRVADLSRVYKSRENTNIWRIGKAFLRLNLVPCL